MWPEYDENLSENKFFKEISTNYSDLIKKASEESWIICVPRLGTFEDTELNIDVILDHIIVPYDNDNFLTLQSKREVTIKNKKILFQNGQPYKSTIDILFEETFYIEKLLKYTLWCIDKPLFSENNACTSHTIFHLESLHDCIDFLWVESLDHEILENIQKLSENFVNNNTELESENLQTQKELIGQLYSQCLQISLKNTHIQRKTNTSAPFLDNLKVAVETYMQYCLNKKLINSVNTLLCQTDSIFNKIVRNSVDIQYQDLNISSKLCDIITSAKCELNNLNNFVTVLDKISCLKRSFNILHQNNVEENEKRFITSDDVLQILVFLILKLNVNNWAANLLYMKEFRFSALSNTDQISFLITSLEAAIEFIKSNHFLDIKNANFTPEISSPNAVQIIFDKIRLGDLESIRLILSNKPDIKNEDNLCHPLCSCDTCENLVTISKTNNSISLKTKNDKGQNFLTYSVIFGHCDLVEYFLSKKVSVNVSDYIGKTPMHYASLKGFQDILLLLINANAYINAVDHEKNTPLHLAAENGHENCVKALLYSSHDIRVNIPNVYGYTPLYLATKWSYIEIIKILIENWANPNIKSKNNKNCYNIANNFYSSKLLSLYCNENNNNFKENKSNTSEELESPSKEKIINLDCKEHGLKPKTLFQIKKLDLLLKAIENNDLPLAFYHLGFVNNSKTDLETSKRTCHPLCNCDNCKITENSENVALKPLEHININMCNANGFTPLHVASKFGRTEILRLLLDSSALINVKTYKTLYTPLHLACMFQRLNNLRELLKCGDCKVDPVDFKGNTPLYYACMSCDTKVVDLLLSNGADCNVRNFSGKTIQQEVKQKNFYGISKILNEYNNFLEPECNSELF